MNTHVKFVIEANIKIDTMEPNIKKEIFMVDDNNLYEFSFKKYISEIIDSIKITVVKIEIM